MDMTCSRTHSVLGAGRHGFLSHGQVLDAGQATAVDAFIESRSDREVRASDGGESKESR